jgi:hypothetical protein
MSKNMFENSVKNKVLEFPKSQSLRKRLLDRGQDQKAVLGLSIISVLVVTIFLNEWIVKSQNSVNSIMEVHRGIASFEDRDSVEGIKWEHELAQKLAEEKDMAESRSAMSAVKPTIKDELVFGFLEGKYKTQMVNAKIEGFAFSDAQAGDQPLVIKEKAEFLKIFKSVFSIDFAKVVKVAKVQRLETREASQELYRLLNASNKDLGQALFQLDEQGRVLSLKITTQ